jgi:hypothetical protein
MSNQKIDLFAIAQANGHHRETFVVGSVTARCESERCIVTGISVDFRSLLALPINNISCPICGRGATVTAIETRHDGDHQNSKTERTELKTGALI